MFLPQVFLNSSVLSVQVLLLAAGLYLIYMVSQVYHIALAGIMVFGAYGFYLAQNLGFPFGGAVLMGILVSVLAGIGTYWLLKPFINRKQSLLALLFSVALWMASQALVSIVFSSEGKFLTEGILPTFHWGGLVITQVGFWSLIVGFLTVLVASFVLFGLPVGRSLRAVRQHGAAANVVGIKETRMQIWTYAMASALAGTIGILVSLNTVLTPTAGNDLIIIAFIALLVGGVHEFKGTVVATLILVFIPQLVLALPFENFSISSSWKMVIVFLLALTLLFLRPRGLFTPENRVI